VQASVRFKKLERERERERGETQKQKNRTGNQSNRPHLRNSQSQQSHSKAEEQRFLESKDESYRSEFLFVTRRSWEFLIRSILLDYTQERRFGKRFLGFRETKKAKRN
jgi:hypothetical protein